MEKVVSGVTIQVVRGDITKQPDVDAVVNAANAQLRTGGGVAGAIHRAAGPGLEQETQALAPIEPGQAVITGGHNLANRHVIHCLGPVYGRDKPEDQLLGACYRNALARAEEKGLTSVAFPAVSTGAFAYPLREAANVALRTVIDATSSLESVKRVRFVLFGSSDYDVHAEILERLTR
jgi:O-acetyl-ADP-ribose deacetylase (regulator of RNase III)